LEVRKVPEHPKAERYAPPAISVIGSLAADTQIREVLDTLGAAANGKSY
jgi:hypothetical protein